MLLVPFIELWLALNIWLQLLQFFAFCWLVYTLEFKRVQFVSIFSGYILKKEYRASVAQLVEYRAVMREVVSSTTAGLSLRVLK